MEPGEYLLWTDVDWDPAIEIKTYCVSYYGKGEGGLEIAENPEFVK